MVAFVTPLRVITMATTMLPSTEWKENIAADEADRFERYGNLFAAIQARKTAKYEA